MAQTHAQALKVAGREGLDTKGLVQAVVAAGVKAWEDEEGRKAKSSVASTCAHDPAFARLEKGRFALRALRPDLEVRACALPPPRQGSHMSGVERGTSGHLLQGIAVF
jgi:hypothetical protein